MLTANAIKPVQSLKMKKSKILKNQEPISKSIWRLKQFTDGDDCPNKVRWEDVTLGGLVAREPASSLAKSSSRSSVLSDPLLLPRFLSTLSPGIHRRFGQTGLLFVDPAGDSARTRGERASTIHHATATNPIQPTKRTEPREQRDNNRSLTNDADTMERERKRERGWRNEFSTPGTGFWTPRETASHCIKRTVKTSPQD